MKNRVIFGLLFIAAGVLIILSPTVLFPVCGAHEMKMACYYTKQAEIGIGGLIAALGVVYLLFSNKDLHIGLSIAQLFSAVTVILYPLKLTGLCKMADMACRVKTLPALVVLSILLAVIAVISIIIQAKRNENS